MNPTMSPTVFEASSARRGGSICMVAPALPPKLDGIGDHTALLAAALADLGNDVTVLSDRNATAGPIGGGVSVRGVFDPEDPTSNVAIADAVAVDRPDWVVLQYNPFAYGRRGFNLRLPGVMARLRRRSPTTRLAIMFHETFVPAWPWRFGVMTTWQRYQFLRLGRVADVSMFSIDPWARRFRRWFPGKAIVHLPVGSNLPRVAIDRGEARRRLDVADDEFILGVFGTAHISRPFGVVRDAAVAIRAAGRRVRVLYVGPDPAVVRAAMGDVPTIAADGPLPGDEASRRLSACDLFIAAYSDGVSTRRGAMMAALQHGLPTLGTRGKHSDAELVALDGDALVLTPAGDDAALARAAVALAADAERRAALGAAAAAAFESRYAWPVIARRMLDALDAAPTRDGSR